MGKHKKTWLKELEPGVKKVIQGFPKEDQPILGKFYIHPETQKAISQLGPFTTSGDIKPPHPLFWRLLFRCVLDLQIEKKEWGGKYPNILRDAEGMIAHADIADDLADYLIRIQKAYYIATIPCGPSFSDRIFSSKDENTRQLLRGHLLIFDEDKKEYHIPKKGELVFQQLPSPVGILRAIGAALRSLSSAPPIPSPRPGIPPPGRQSSPQVDFFVGGWAGIFRKTVRPRCGPQYPAIAALLNGALDLQGEDAFDARKVQEIDRRLKTYRRRKRALKQDKK